MHPARTARCPRYALCALAGFTVLLSAASTAMSLRLTLGSYHTVLMGDQWDTVPFFERLLQGTATFGDFIAQHNEHRLLFARLVFALDLLLSNASNSVNFAAILLCQAITAALFYRLIAARTSNYLVRLAMTAFVVLLLFSIVQMENFFWGFQVQFVGVFMFVALSAYLLSGAQTRDGAMWWALFAAGLFFGAGAALMMSNGAAALLCVALVFLAARLFNRTTTVVGLAGALVVVLYAATFTPVSGHTPLGFAPAHPGIFLEYVAVYLGSIFYPLSLGTARAAGFGGLALAAVAGLGLFSGRLARDRINLTLVAILWFVALTAAMTAVGRLSFGLEQAGSSRYATPSALFWAAAGTLVVLNLLSERHAQRVGAALTLLAALAVLPLASTAYVQREFRAGSQFRNIGIQRATDAMLSNVHDEAALLILFPRTEDLEKRLIPVLKAWRLNIFSRPLPFPLGTQVPEQTVADQARCFGSMDRIDPVPGAVDSYLLHGWVWEAVARKPVDRMILLSEDRRVLGYGSSGTPRWDATAQNSGISSMLTGWVGYARMPGTPVITAYGLLGDGKLCRVGSAAVQ